MLASNQDWMIYLRDAGQAAKGSCGSSGERVLVALHRAPVSTGTVKPSQPSTLDVNLGLTWMEGCRLGRAEILLGQSSAVVAGETLHLQAQGDGVWIGNCQ